VVDIALFLELQALWEDILSSQIQFGRTCGSFDRKLSGCYHKHCQGGMEWGGGVLYGYIVG
jgi:hypothetical protein